MPNALCDPSGTTVLFWRRVRWPGQVAPSAARNPRCNTQSIGPGDVYKFNAGALRGDIADHACHLKWQVVVMQTEHSGVFVADFRCDACDACHSAFADFADQAGRTSLLAVTASTECNRPTGKGSLIGQAAASPLVRCWEGNCTA